MADNEKLVSKNVEELKVDVYWLIKAYIPEVVDISMSCFEDSWTSMDFLEVLEHGGLGLVLRVDGSDDIVGYVIYDLIDNKIQILNMAVTQEYRYLKMGNILIQEMKYRMKTQNKDIIDIEVPESNVGAQLFLKSQGFRFVRTLKDYFESISHSEDGYVFQYAESFPADNYPELTYENRIAKFLK